MERAVGWFIMLATLLLLFGFGYYIYNTAESRGWFKIKASYFIYAENGNGLAVGNTVKLMGFDAGRITRITEMPPTWGQSTSNNVYIEFEVLEPNFGYIWTEGSRVQVKQAGFLSARELDVNKGLNGYATYLTQPFRDDLTVAQAQALPNLDKWRLGQEIWTGTNLELHAWVPLNATNLDKITALLGTKPFRVIDSGTKGKRLTGVWNEHERYYERFSKTNLYGLERFEEPALTDRLQALVTQVQVALPGVLQLTNQLALVLSNATRLTSNLDVIVENARPVVTNLSLITAQLTNPAGSLGEWLIPTNLNQKLNTTLATADGAITNLNTNLVTLNLTLANLANITSNLNHQVQANTNILSNISSVVVHSDEFIQGLKRFWLFRHLFAAHKTKTPPARQAAPVTSPKSNGY